MNWLEVLKELVHMISFAHIQMVDCLWFIRGQKLTRNAYEIV